MPRLTYLPSRDRDLLGFANNMNAWLAANAASVGISAAQQAAFDAHTTTFANAMAAMLVPGQRNGPWVVAKNDAREALIAGENGIRELVSIIQAFPGTTDEARSQLRGLRP